MGALALTKRRPAYTLIEVLVVLAVVGVLFGLLIPSVNMARESARRCSCMNNLRQVSLGVQTYADMYEVLPPGVVNDTSPIKNTPRGYHVGWLVRILPFISQPAVSKNFNLATSVYDTSNDTCRRFLINIYLCPSDRSKFARASDGVASSSYAACHHNAEAPIAETNNGVFFLNSKLRYDDIPDGTSNTVFIGEKLLLGGELGWASGTRSTLRNAGTFPIGVTRLRGGVTVIPDPGQGKGAELEATSADPVGGFSSAHFGITNFAFGDGSVRILTSAISPQVFRALADRAGGELLSNDKF